MYDIWVEKLLAILVKHKKVILGVSLGVLVALLGVGSYFIMEERAKTATVTIYVAPRMAEVKVGGEKLKNGEERKIKPGEYTVEISAEGFETKRGSLTALAGETSEVRAYLEPLEGNKDYYSLNEADGVIVGEIEAAKTRAELEELMAANPILEKLPLEIDFFTNDYSRRVNYIISYRVADDYKSFVITITDYTGGNYADALAKLRARGFEPEGRAIEYIDQSDDWLGGKAF